VRLGRVDLQEDLLHLLVLARVSAIVGLIIVQVADVVLLVLSIDDFVCGFGGCLFHFEARFRRLDEVFELFDGFVVRRCCWASSSSSPSASGSSYPAQPAAC
jgi:hypothetical protein